VIWLELAGSALTPVGAVGGVVSGEDDGLVNVAVTDVGLASAIVHAPVPEQPAVQPAKTEPAAGVAESVTPVPTGKLAEHVDPQAMPAGVLVTVPLPVPATLTVREVESLGTNVAVTVVVAASETEHEPVPAQPPPLQPVNAEPAAAAAESVTVVPLVNIPEQLAPQLIPAGALVTVPVPAPILRTDRPKSCGVALHAVLE
jgi:hypothetical protein